LCGGIPPGAVLEQNNYRYLQLLAKYFRVTVKNPTKACKQGAAFGFGAGMAEPKRSRRELRFAEIVFALLQTA